MGLPLLLLLLGFTLCTAQNDVCGSCKDNCGVHTSYCGCDSLCKIYNDCCYDFETVCPKEKRTGVTNFFRFRGVSVDKLTQCQRVDFGTGYRHVPLVTACPHDAHACNVSSTDVTNLVPVTELGTGLNFVTAGCAECNGVTVATVWDTKLLCDDRVYVQLHVDNSSANSNQVKHNTLQELLVHHDCQLSIRVPPEARRPCDPDIIDMCTDGSAWNEKECRYGSTDFVTDGIQNYKNKVCANCNAVPPARISCGLNTLVFNLAPVIYGKFSLSLLMDFSGDGLMVKSGRCETGYTKVAHDCLPIICPDGFALEGDDCIEIPKLDVTIHFHVKLDPEGRSDAIKDELTDPDFLYVSLEAFFLHRYDKITNLTISLNVSGSIEVYSVQGHSMSIPGIISYTVHNITMDSPSAQPPLMDLSQVLRNLFEQHLQEELGEVSNLEVKMKPLEDEDLRFSEVSASCTQIQLSQNEYTIQNDSIHVISTGQDIELKHVSFKKDGTVAICENVMIRKPASSSSHLGITTIVVLSISLLCLLVRMVLQFFITAFHTAPMKLQFCLSLSLFTGFLAFLFNPFLGEGTVPCHILGIYIQWVFLLAFCWMMVISFDMWWIFRPSGGFMKLSEGAGFFWRYLIVAVLVSSIITSIGLLFEYTELSYDFKPNYGHFLCFFNNTRALLVFFVIPLIGIVIINLIFFAVTCVNLHRALSSMQKFQRQKWRQELCLYIRLFSLMGITWIFGIVAPLVPTNDVLWYLFIIFNGLQGLYIFVAYVCTSKVYNELRRICGFKEVKQSSTGSTRSTSRSESITSRGSKRGKYSKGNSSTTNGNRTLDTSVGDSIKGHSNRVSIEVTNGTQKLPNETSV